LNPAPRAVLPGFVPQEFHYRLPWRVRGLRAGAHAARTPGSGFDFAGYVPFTDHPDPRRLDLRASLRTFPRQFMVRSFHQHGAITVYAVLDLSASMRFSGHADKQRLLADIAASIAWSATRNGDAFALVAADDEIRADLCVLPSRRTGVATEIHRQVLQASIEAGQRSGALPHAAQVTGRGRSLVFLVSDFHHQPAELDRTLRAFAAHDVQPLVLWDSAEYDDLPDWGWARVRDLENGGERSLFLRRKLVQRIRAAYAERRADLGRLCRNAGLRPPFFVENRFDADLLTRHLLEAA
jgi:uncharacterized protein (DUF58 family)